MALGLEIRMTIPNDRAGRLRDRQRSVEGRTGCGLCGIMSLEQALRPLPVMQAAPVIEAQAITEALAALPALQLANQASGAAHAAAFATTDGKIRLVREDVGRHNAFDKLIGGMARAGIDPVAGFVVLTSRFSAELVQKAAIAGIGIVAAVSAPTTLAIELAQAAGLTLIAFARGHGFSIYTHPQRIPAGMNHEPLVRMANQIARAFATQSASAAVASTATHIRLFWDPRMRQGLNELLATGGEGLDPTALAAAERLAQQVRVSLT